MYHSLSFWTKDQDTSSGGRNTWASWRLIPSSRPYIAPPSQKTVYEEIPYANGVLDFSEFGLEDGVFNNREGSIEFTAVNKNTYGFVEGYKRSNNGNKMTLLSMEEDRASSDDILDWDREYSEIMNYLHGEIRKVVLEDDPSFYYIGRLEMEDLSTEDYATKYSLNYNLEPFKRVRFTPANIDHLLWDAIDFEANLDILGLKNATLKSGDFFETTFSTLRNTIYPDITVSSSSNQTKDIATIKITNDNGSYKEISLNKGKNKADSGIGNLYFKGMQNNLNVRITNESKGVLTFTLDYCLEGL